MLDAIRDDEIDGMQDFDSVIRKLIETKVISLEDGLSYATNQNNLLLQLKGLSSTEDYRNGNNTRAAVQPMAPPPPPAATHSNWTNRRCQTAVSRLAARDVRTCFVQNAMPTAAFRRPFSSLRQISPRPPLQVGKTWMDAKDESDEKPRRILLCLGERRDAVAMMLTEAGYKVYIAQTPAQANERLREGKTEIVIFSPDFAAEYGGAALVQQKANAMYTSERRRLFLISLEDGGTTMNAHEAFIRNLNLIVNTADMQQLPLILNRALHDFNGLYHYPNRSLGLEPI